MPTKHIVRLPDGTTDKRISVNRVYPFAVIARHNRKHDEIVAERSREQAAANWDYYNRGATLPLGTPYDPARPWHAVDDDDKERGLEIIAEYPTREAYAEAQVRKALERIEASAAKGHYDRWSAITWTSRADLAAKEQDRARKVIWTGVPLWLDVQIAETERS